MTPASTKKAAGKKSAKTPATSSASSTAIPRDTAANAVDEQLARYRSMRDFHITAEPAGSARPQATKPTAQLPFCIQKHAASHLHYDFRLGWNGVLKSWACRQGPQLCRRGQAPRRPGRRPPHGVRRLRRHHPRRPVRRRHRHAVGPGHLGAAARLPRRRRRPAQWLTSSSSCTAPRCRASGPSSAWAARPAAQSATKPNWLLIKEHDDFERTPTDPAITDDEPNSVITGRTIEQIAANEDHVWNSKETAAQPEHGLVPPDASHSRQQPECLAPAHATGAPATRNFATLTKPSQRSPARLPRAPARPAGRNPPDADGWLHELKLDGYRIQARKSTADSVQLLTRNGLDWTHRMPDLAAEIARLPAESATLDGEVVVLADDGTTSFADLQAAFQEGRPQPPHLLRLRPPAPRRPQSPRPPAARAQGPPRAAPRCRRPRHPPPLRAPRRRRRRDLPQGLRAPRRRHHLQARRRQVLRRPLLRLAQIQVPPRAGVRHRRLHPARRRPHRHARHRRAPARLLRQGRKADLRRPHRHRLQPEDPQAPPRQARSPQAARHRPSTSLRPTPAKAPSGSSPNSSPRSASPPGPPTTWSARPPSSACAKTSPPPKSAAKPPPPPPNARPAKPPTSTPNHAHRE